MAPLLFLSQQSFWFSRSPPRASTDRCFLQLNCSCPKDSLNKIRCTFSLQSLGLTRWCSLTEHWNCLRIRILCMLCPPRSSKIGASGVCATQTLVLLELPGENVQPGLRAIWVHSPPGFTRLGATVRHHAALLSLPGLLAPLGNSLLPPGLLTAVSQLLEALQRENPVHRPMAVLRTSVVAGELFSQLGVRWPCHPSQREADIVVADRNAQSQVFLWY